MTNTDRPLGRIHLIADLDVFRAEGEAAGTALPLIDAGLPSLQLRGRGRTTRELVHAGRALRRAAAGAGCLFVVNGDADAARELEADGLHLSAASLPGFPRDLPAGMRIGASCHDREELSRATGVDWVFVSPIFPTESKPGATGLGVAGLRGLMEHAPAPVYALGGVTAHTVPDLLDAGCAGVAAIRAFRGDSGRELLAAARGHGG